MGEYRTLGLIIAAVFALLGLGAWFSPSYTQQMGYLEAIIFAGSLLFIVSVVILVAAAGFRTFALYLGVLTAMAVAAFGLYGGLLVLGLTYVTWGFVFGIEFLLAHHRVPTALAWFRRYYTARVFQIEYRLFYPMLWVLFGLLDVMPRLLYRETGERFVPSETFRYIREYLLTHAKH